MRQKTIAIIDDHALFRSGLRTLLLDAIPNIFIIEGSSLQEALTHADADPALVLLDIKLPGLNGVEGIALLKKQWPKSPVVVVSASDDNETMREVLARGAVSFVSKTVAPEEMLRIFTRILAGKYKPSQPQPASPGQSRFTPRQCEVLELMRQGLTNKVIARRLSLSENTVRWHVQAILGELQVSTRQEAVFEAQQKGIIG